MMFDSPQIDIVERKFIEKDETSPSLESVNLSACVAAKISDESFLKEKIVRVKPGEGEDENTTPISFLQL
jgi:hypothetical protein